MFCLLPAAPQPGPSIRPSITGLAINQYKQPASYQYSIGVQRQLNAKSVLSISYVGNQNRYQNNYREINLPSESYLPALIAGAQYNNAPGLPYPGYHSINFSTNEANSHYNSLQVDLNSHVPGPDPARVLHAVTHDRSNHLGQWRRRSRSTFPILTSDGSMTTGRVASTGRTTPPSTSSMTSRSFEIARTAC